MANITLFNLDIIVIIVVIINRRIQILIWMSITMTMVGVSKLGGIRLSPELVKQTGSTLFVLNDRQRH